MSKLKTFQDTINPIVLKELRQAVRGRFMPVLLCTYLFVQVMVMLVNADNSQSNNFGVEMMMSYFSVLGVVVIIFVPFVSAIRHAFERNSDNLDLLYITSLPAKNIVTGKFIAGVVTSLLFFSATMPFIALTLLLRGVDIQSIVGMTFILFVASPLALQGALTASSFSMSRILQILVGLAGLFGLIMLLVMVLSGMFGLNNFGTGSTSTFFLEPEFLTLVGSAIFFIVLFQKVGVALIQPGSANRARPVRQTLTIGWCLSLFAGIAIGGDGVEVWSVIVSTLLAIHAFAVVCERTALNTRIRSELPKQPYHRMWYFFHSSGQANGFIWTLVMMGLTSAIAFAEGSSEPFHIALALCSGGLTYSLWGAFLYRKFFYRFVQKKFSWLIALFLLAIGTAGPWLVTLTLSPGSRWTNFALLHFLNPFAVIDQSSYRSVIVFALCVAALFGLVFNWRVLRDGMRQYQPIQKQEPQL